MTDRRIAWWRSLRLRIALAVALVSLAVSLPLGYVLARQAADAATESLRDQALGRLQAAVDGYQVDGRLRAQVSADPAYPPAALRETLGQPGRATYLDDDAMWAAHRLDQGTLLTVRLDAAALRAQDRTRMATLGVASSGAVLASVVLGWAVATRLSRRLRRAAAAADEIAAGRSQIHASQGGADEVAALTRAVDAMADALRSRLEAEQAFTADVAHELRTPLTGLVSAVELLPGGEPTELVRAQVARLRRLVEDLLEISRLDHARTPPQLAAVDLATAAAQAVAAAGVDARVTSRVVSSRPVLADPRRLERILDNLLVNLARHGGGDGDLTIDGHTLTLRDHGPGYPAALLAHGPRPFHAEGAHPGSGLGLAIAVKQAASMGAELVFADAPGGGALATLRLRDADGPVGPARPDGTGQLGRS